MYLRNFYIEKGDLVVNDKKDKRNLLARHSADSGTTSDSVTKINKH
jgi:hypothetical protein